MLEDLVIIQGLLVRGRPEGVHVVGPPGGGVLLRVAKTWLRHQEICGYLFHFITFLGI